MERDDLFGFCIRIRRKGRLYGIALIGADNGLMTDVEA